MFNLNENLHINAAIYYIVSGLTLHVNCVEYELDLIFDIFPPPTASSMVARECQAPSDNLRVITEVI